MPYIEGMAGRSPLIPVSVVALALFSGVGVVSRAAAQTFDLIGHPDPNAVGFVYGLSADGSTAAGGLASGGAGFTWTRAGGRNVYGTLPGMPNTSMAYAISGDGMWTAGQASGGGTQAYRYRLGDPSLQMLGVLPGYPSSRALGISGNGEVVVGRNTPVGNDDFGQAFRWTSTTGMVGLGFLQPGQFYSEAAAVSRDGSTIVGSVRQTSGYDQAFVWREGTGMVGLPGLSATNDGRAFGVNPNGSLIVGSSIMGPREYATMWVNGIPVSLGLADGFTHSRARGVNDAGSVIVGQLVGTTTTAAVWTPDRGLEPLSAYLSFHSITVPAGVNLLTATAVSADGMTITGYTGLPGFIQDGYVVHIPAPPAVVIAGAMTFAWAACRRRQHL
ncbi:MAG: hypothetical protein HBSAPP03_09820 [Phycisphaerae bacterium]|nr:MAG: hypothetical protein HBSAPP03_09820 [Phycisphaerae bacterium]